MKLFITALTLGAILTLGGCSGEAPLQQTVQPVALTDTAIGHYCGMVLLEHPGPKGQIILAGTPEPVWFSSVRDAVAFTILPEEPKNITAIYVSDMAAAPSWEEPGAENWIDAKQAFFVIGSAMRGGMGAEEAVPFSTETAANDFVRENGGEVVGFPDIPRDYVLGTATAEQSLDEEATVHVGGMSH